MTFAQVGLLFDIVGAFWLARAIVHRRDEDIQKACETKLGMNRLAYWSAVVGKCEGKWGFCFLIMGFILQFGSTYYSYHAPVLDLVAIVVLFQFFPLWFCRQERLLRLWCNEHKSDGSSDNARS